METHGSSELTEQLEGIYVIISDDSVCTTATLSQQCLSDLRRHFKSPQSHGNNPALGQSLF